MSRMKQTLVTVLTIVSTTNIAIGSDWRANAKAIDISGGEDHTLILTENKWPWACGHNGWYQLGTGNDQDQKTLVGVLKGDMNSTSDYLENIDDVDAGWTHSLALDVNSLVWAWGNNEQGQLGDAQHSSQYYSGTPVIVHDGEMNTASGYLEYIIAISAGRSGLHSLAMDANGYAYGWGYNAYGQCGNDANNWDELTPVYVHQGAQPADSNDESDRLKHIVGICAGSNNSIALEADLSADPNSLFEGCVYTWGCNMWGEEPCDVGIVSLGRGLLGTASDVNFSDTPVKVLAGEQHPNDPNQPYLNHIVAVAAGWDHCMAVENDDPWDPNLNGRVFTWGHNGPGWGGGAPVGWESSVGGRLGNGTYNDSNVPVLVLAGEQYPPDPNSPLKHIIAVSGGEGHSMALDADGYVYCWGDNQYGQLGNDTNVPSTTPVRVLNPQDPNLPLSNIVAISAGHWHSLAIDSNGVVWVWGKTKDGRLGLADMACAEPCVCALPHRIPVVCDYNDAGVGKGFAFSIQEAINAASEGDVLEASWGIYYENVTLGDQSITVKSEAPDDPEVVADTIIDAVYNSGSGYLLYKAVNFNAASGSTLAGLTLRNARGGGVLCDNVNSVTLMSCLIRNNGCHGIWLYASSVDIQNCEIRGNASDETSDGHGVYCMSGSDVNIVNCIIADNDCNEWSGINCTESTAAIRGCAIQDNAGFGVEAIRDCDITIERSLIEGNGKTGVYAYDDCDFVLNGSVVRNNGWEGVGLEYNSSNTLTNNWIHNNGTIHPTFRSGIWFLGDNVSSPVVRNNTICGNPRYGIEVGENSYIDPNILNCIIYGNSDGDLQRVIGTFASVNYCCLQDSNSGTGNIVVDPCFIDADANDFHLAANSPCIDSGDPDFTGDVNETDIDGEERVVNGRVDMGADEFYWSPADFNGDGIVNFLDYAMLAWHWHETDVNGGDNDVFDLVDNNAIDFGDILAFCDEWLWQAGSLTGPLPLMAGRGGAGMLEGLGLDAGLSAVAAAEREPAIAEPVDIEAIMKWLAEIWLDPDVRKSIDEEKLLKVYESLKELSNQ